MNTPTATRQTAGSRAVRVPEPRTRDADRTQQAILQAATDEFSATGLGGARMENIAARAGVNKRLIYYYFGSKEDLFLAVLEDTYASIREAEKKLRLENLDPATGVRRLVEFTWDYYLANPHFLTLLNSENLHKAKHLNRSARIQEMNSPLVQLLSDLLQRGQQANLFRGGVDPVQLYISIASLCYFYLSNNATLSTIFGRDLLTPTALSERLSHMTEVIMGYLLRK
ncbi:MAG: TetR family transcriptional regulator [Gammaproteobacteria bacterium]|nr:TetR family transcriptional regulator [Gammaproteobacteria bacterium]MBU1442494.1 TetR family transcriptional regulator [Gammaproteobacteria bacterium]MBU2287347.1 TetR family transcriptional regulator [Gammaproteobacteria bacterium]